MLDRAGLSNLEVAKHLEVATETVSRWRNGQQIMRGRDLRALLALLASRGFVVTEAWLHSGEMAQPERGIELPDPAKDRKLTEQEAARAVEAAELEERQRAGKARRVANRGSKGRGPA